MRAFLRFRTSHGNWAVAVDHTVGVRSAADLVALPSPAPGVVGLLCDRTHPLPVVDGLGHGGDLVVVLEREGGDFGVLAEEVIGIERVGEDGLGPRPPGQRRDLVSATYQAGEAVVLVIDPTALAAPLLTAGRLRPARPSRGGSERWNPVGPSRWP